MGKVSRSVPFPPASWLLHHVLTSLTNLLLAAEMGIFHWGMWSPVYSPPCHPDHSKLAEGISILRPSGCHSAVSCSPGKTFPALLCCCDGGRSGISPCSLGNPSSLLPKGILSPPSEVIPVLFCPIRGFWGLCGVDSCPLCPVLLSWAVEGREMFLPFPGRMIMEC